MKIANQYLVKYNTQIIEISIRPRSITHWQLPKLTLKVNESEIKIKDVDLIFDKHLSLFNFSADQLLKIALGSIDVTLSPNVLMNEDKMFDSQGPTLALNIAQLPQIDIGYTQLKFKGIPSTSLSIDLAYLRLNKQGQLTSLLNLQGKKLFALNAQLNEKKWTISTSIVFEQLQILLTQVTQRVHDSSALSLLLQAKARLDKLGLKFNGTLNSQADLNLKTAQLYSIHELVDTEVTLTKLSNLTIQPSTLALLPNTSVVFPNTEPQHSPNRLIKFEINGHIADLSLTLLPLSLQLTPNHQQQAVLFSFINDDKWNKIINLLHLGNRKNKKESSKLTLVASLNKPLTYSFQSREIKAQHVQLSLENENVTATSSLKELNLKLPVDDSGPTLNSQWSLKAQTKNRLGLEQLFDENLTSPKLTLAKTSLVMHGELKVAQLNNKALSPSHQALQFNDVQLSLNVDKEIQLISEGFSVEAVSDNKNAAMNMKIASLSLFSHSPLQASYDSGAVSFVLPSLTLALGPISYYHPQPSAKAKEIEFKANNLTFYAIAPSYLTAEVASDNKHDLANMSFQFTGSTFSLVSSGVRFLDKQLSSLIDKQENAQAQLTPPSVSISTQEARFTSLDTFIVNSVHDNTNTDTGKTSGWLTIQLPSFTLEQTDTEFIHISRQEGQTVVENKEAKAQSPTPRNQEVTGLLPQLSMTIFEPTTLELNLKNGISLPRLLSQTSWVNNAKYHIEGLEVTRLYHKNKRLRTEKLLQLYQGTVTQTFNWNTTRLVTHEQWEFDELELNSEHKVTPNLTHKGLTPLSIEGKINLDTELSTILAVVEATYPLPTAFYADGHAALNASYKFTQAIVLDKENGMSTQKVRQFTLDFTPTLSKLSGSINELPFEEATMDANCQLSLHNSQEREALDNKEQSTLFCPDINLSATAFNPGVLIEDFNSHASLSVSLDSEHLIDPAHKEPSANIPANLSDLNIQMNAAGKLLGGEFTLPEFSLKLKERSYGYLVLQGLSLAELIAIQPQVGLYADGTFDGVLPVELVDGKASVSGGRLAARAPGGLITLNGNPAVEQMRTSQPYLNFAFSALEHLEYSQLSSSFDMEPSGDAILNVNVKGRAKGIERPIHLNYSQEENMLQLLKSLQIGDKLQTQIEHSMN